MQEVQLKQVVFRWGLPIAIFLLLIIFMVVGFSVKSRETGKKNVADTLTTTAEKYALKIGNELEEMTAGGKTVAGFLSLYTEKDLQEGLRAASVLQESTDAFQVIVCNTEGIGLHDKHVGNWIDISKTDYFEEVKRIEKPTYFFTKDDGYRGKNAIVSAIPLIQNEEIEGYILMYYDPNELPGLFKKVDFNSDTFYVMVDESGRIICSSGNLESSIFANGNFMDGLKDQGENDKTIERLYRWMLNRMSGIEYVNADKNEKGLIFVPIDINHWYLVIGVDEAFIRDLEGEAWTSAKKILIELIAVITIFCAALIVINCISFTRANARDKMLAAKADTDLLTGLSNKIATERKIKEYIVENPNQLAMMFVLDIDNFKKINDTQGHAFGDEVLRILGMRLKSEFRTSDIVGRSGGDEFTIFLKNIKDIGRVEAESKRVERIFHNFQVGEYVKYAITASIGVAVYPNDAEDFEELYKASDHALYIAKRRGKNQLAFYGDDKE